MKIVNENEMNVLYSSTSSSSSLSNQMTNIINKRLRQRQQQQYQRQLILRRKFIPTRVCFCDNKNY
ncbi:hypothetical protein DERP_001634 [Dermatophagoides pteronyssinus]|uniref:Uncharacterized protein n=1 Tax=Dermatophagoides pteronyssinus TaxID=6956 RepID=A0ABQ8JB83_DERPT|nr:hypothetical protein DERP_001634 [Dermatophagoides pteronyssinus]